MNDPQRIEKEIARRIEALTKSLDAGADDDGLITGPVARSQKRVRAELQDLARWAAVTAPLQDDYLVAHDELDQRKVSRESTAGNTLPLWFRIKLYGEMQKPKKSKKS